VASQLLTLYTSRHQSGGSQIVEMTQITVSKAFQPTQAIVFDVLMEVGVKTTDDTDAGFTCSPYSSPAHRAFGGDINRLRGKAFECTGNAAGYRQTKAQAVIAGNWQAGQTQQIIGLIAFSVIFTLTRTDQLNLHAAGTQSAHQMPQRIGNAVDLGGKGFCHYGDPLQGGLAHKHHCSGI